MTEPICANARREHEVDYAKHQHTEFQKLTGSLNFNADIDRIRREFSNDRITPELLEKKAKPDEQRAKSTPTVVEPSSINRENTVHNLNNALIYVVGNNHGYGLGRDLDKAMKINPLAAVKVLESQFDVLKSIQSKPGSLIFIEGYNPGFNIDKSNPDLATIQIMRDVARNAVFPRGIPDSFEDLNELQMKFIFEYGGSRSAFYLGLTDRLYSATSEKESQRIHTELSKLGSSDVVKDFLRENHCQVHQDPMINLDTVKGICQRLPINAPEEIKDIVKKFQDLMMTQREEILLGEIEKETQKEENKGKSVIIVIGESHENNLKQRIGDCGGIVGGDLTIHNLK